VLISRKIQTQFYNGVIFDDFLLLTPSISTTLGQNAASQAQVLHFFHGIFASRENRKSEIHRGVKYAQTGLAQRTQILLENTPEALTNIV